jgi:hypothetical protein
VGGESSLKFKNKKLSNFSLNFIIISRNGFVQIEPTGYIDLDPLTLLEGDFMDYIDIYEYPQDVLLFHPHSG